MGKKQSLIFTLTATGIFGALAFLATYFLGIPYAGGAGYLAFGDAISLLATYLFGPIVGLGSALIGAVFSDLAKGFAAFIPFSVLSKSLMVFVAALFHHVFKGKRSAIIGFWLGGLIMPLGYLPAYLWLYPEYAWINFLFDLVQGLVCASVAFLLYIPIHRAIKVTP